MVLAIFLVLDLLGFAWVCFGLAPIIVLRSPSKYVKIDPKFVLNHGYGYIFCFGFAWFGFGLAPVIVLGSPFNFPA